MESEIKESSIPKKQYKKISSVANAQKARIGRQIARDKRKEDLKNNPPPPSDDEYSEDEIVYVPTKRKTKKTAQPPSDLNTEIFELKKQLELLKIQPPKNETLPINIPIQPKHNPHHDVINMAKSRILNF